MNRKFMIICVCVAVLGLMALAVIRGGKGTHRSYRSDPPRDNFSVTVDLPNTNNTASQPAGR